MEEGGHKRPLGGGDGTGDDSVDLCNAPGEAATVSVWLAGDDALSIPVSGAAARLLVIAAALMDAADELERLEARG